MRFWLPRTVIVLGVVSMLNDVASEMVAPLVPVLLTTSLAAGPFVVGLVEGLADAVSNILKVVSGRLADTRIKPKTLVLGGYGLASIVRPLIGLAAGWGLVLVLRFLDRVGKGLRTSPRDALISAATDAQTRGRAFGFHRGMDHLGAAVGPVIAYVLLENGMAVREVFLWSVVPGIAALGLLSYGIPRTPVPQPGPAAPRLRWRELKPETRRLIVAAGILAFASVPEAFLVLWALARGLEIVWVPLFWAVAHIVRALVAAPAGSLSDRVGRMPVVVTGWTLRVLLLALLAWLPVEGRQVWIMFAAYAAVVTLTEGAERALIGDTAPERHKATTFGVYYVVIGLLGLPGALFFGTVWEWAGMRTAFLLAALVTLFAAGTLLYSLLRHNRLYK